MLRIIFLDFDGVLHPTSAGASDLCSRSRLLAEVLAGVECDIIISSSWRHHDHLSDIIARLPSSLQPLVRGATGDPFIGRWPRYNEIMTYLRHHHGLGASWRALDDSLIEFPPNCPELIACNPNVGFDVAQAKKLRLWLERR